VPMSTRSRVPIVISSACSARSESAARNVRLFGRFAGTRAGSTGDSRTKHRDVSACTSLCSARNTPPAFGWAMSELDPLEAV